MNTPTITTLDNGLTVILKEVHTAPIVSWWVAYRIGSRNEQTGRTGISHWVEHMMFKGTERYPKGTLDQAIDRAGGSWNAFTSMDYTMYHETLPAQHLDLALTLEADRMVNARFDRDEVESERGVIISERQGRENNPVFWLRETLRATAFRVHGYHHEIIGDLPDLRQISADQLYAHYCDHYVPANAFVVGVGSFETATVLERVREEYGRLTARPVPELFARPEPEQMGERRVVVERPGRTAFLQMSYRAPAATHPDWLKLAILDSILTGPGGPIDNKTSRLYQALVKTGIAASISGGLSETVDPYLFNLSVVVNQGRTLAEAEATLQAEIDRLLNDGITETELLRAGKQARASFAYEAESVTDQAYLLAISAILGQHDWADTYTERVQALTVEEINDVARRTLQSRYRTVGWLVPTESET